MLRCKSEEQGQTRAPQLWLSVTIGDGKAVRGGEGLVLLISELWLFFLLSYLLFRLGGNTVVQM